MSAKDKSGTTCLRAKIFALQVKLPASFSASLRIRPVTTTMTNSLTTDLHSAANEERIEEFTNTQARKHPIMMLSTISVK